MKLKKLELAGFKSFVDRTVVNFDHDVLGIVGPNGCGKSNIVDAIRWCMGEQSAKHLRGAKMEDVIFNGSESRGAHDMAEVTLTFENNDPAELPLEYQGYPEIAVTRRLYRTGESDYLLNKVNVRLRDITDLFLGTGAGTKAYSIVEQGRIGLIVSAKPEDRRLLIEEVAGITKFKAKKKIAERKMEQTAQNLLRIGDIVAEIERNLGSLKRQAQKAERYVAYRKELEDGQLHEASHRYLEHTAWVKAEAHEVIELTQLSDQASSTLTAREADLETLRLRAHETEERLEAATSVHFAADNKVRALESGIERTHDRVASLDARKVQAVDEQRLLSEQAAELEAEACVLQENLSSLEDGARDAEEGADEETARLDELRARLEEAEFRTSELRAQWSALQARASGAEAALAGVARRKTDLEERAARAARDKESLTLDRMEMNEKLEELARALADVSPQAAGPDGEVVDVAALTAELDAARAARPGVDKSLDEARSALNSRAARKKVLSDMHARMDGVGQGVRALLGDKQSDVLGLLSDYLVVPPTYAKAVAAALGDALGGVVARDVPSVQARVSAMGERAGKVVLLPSSSVAQNTPMVLPAGGTSLWSCVRADNEIAGYAQAVLANVWVAESSDLAARAHAEHGVCAVSLDGVLCTKEGATVLGADAGMAAARLDMKRELDELSAALPEAEASLAAQSDAHAQLRTRIASLEVSVDAARKSAHAGELLVVNARADHRAAEARASELSRRIEALSLELEELVDAQELAQQEGDAAMASLDELRDGGDHLHASLDEATRVSEGWQEQVEAQRSRVTDRKVSLASSQERKNAALATISRVRRQADDMAERVRRIDEEISNNAAARVAALASLEDTRTELADAIDAAYAASEGLGEVRAAYESAKSELGERDGGLRDLRAQVDAARAALTQHEIKLAEHRMHLSHLLESVAEKFRGLRLETVVGDYHMRLPPDAELRARIVELSGLIERMGAVNLDAVREYEEAEKRFSFYSEQKADLDRAIADLEKAIAQMNKESKRLFREAFDAVNEKFQVVFPKMFRGGRASLRLTNPDDMLETGIDILAEPPGKKLSSIELMSGGEKALTAVSLIFAIFQIKPSPFCILDEVDAPLDEANVARYNDMVREMTDRSQFILITHIKRTMQMVDVLYGVTMQEPGVSKLVSVKLSEGAERRRTPALTQAAVA